MDNDKMKINIAPPLLTKLNVLSTEYGIEVGGYITGEIRDNEIYLKDLLIPNQQISSGSVNITGADQIMLRKKYGKKVTEIIGHWHSHHQLGCFWSLTDETDMKNVMSFRKFFVWIVSSKGNHLIRVSQREPFSHDFNDCEFYVQNSRLKELRNKMNKLISKNESSFKESSVGTFDDEYKEDIIQNDE